MQLRHLLNVLGKPGPSPEDAAIRECPCLFDLAIAEKDAAYSDAVRLDPKVLQRPNAVDRKLQTIFVACRSPHFPVNDFHLRTDLRAIVDAAIDRELSYRGKAAEGMLYQLLLAVAQALDEGADFGIFKECPKGLEKSIESV